jgi:hypothetical protein
MPLAITELVQMVETLKKLETQLLDDLLLVQSIQKDLRQVIVTRVGATHHLPIRVYLGLICINKSKCAQDAERTSKNS